MKLRLEVGIQNDMAIPSGFRTAWIDSSRNVRVLYRWPVHLLMRCLLEGCWRLEKFVQGPSRLQCGWERNHQLQFDLERLAQEYAQGYLEGWQECFDQVRTVIGGQQGQAADEDPSANKWLV